MSEEGKEEREKSKEAVVITIPDSCEHEFVPVPTLARTMECRRCGAVQAVLL